MGTLVMARGSEGKPSRPAPSGITIRGSAEWRAWVDRGAEFCRTDTSKLIDAALIEYLKARGFTEPPPKR